MKLTKSGLELKSEDGIPIEFCMNLSGLNGFEKQMRMARQHLPKGFSWELPILLNDPLAGLPRVYDIALEIIAHGDGPNTEGQE